MRRVSTWLVIAGLILVLGVANYDIWQKQQIVENGQQILLKLRPVDPRSLMQGDFMRLRYADIVLPDSMPGTTPHLERCTAFLEENDKVAIANSCDEAVVVMFMPDGQRATEFTVRPMERLVTELSFPDDFVYTTCPNGYVSSVPVRAGRRSIISRSQYLCIEPTASIERAGTIVLKLGGNGVGTSVRYDDDSRVLGNEVRLQYKRILGTGELTLGAESFFFQEGQAQIYQRARYGVLRVDEDGASVLVGLADDQRQLITPPQ
jgi:uncharacterized membrane-anchored protein